MQRDLSFLVAFADDGDRVDDGVDVVAFDGGDLADPESGVGGEQDHRAGPPVHPGVEQDRKVFVGDRSGPALLDLRRGAIVVGSSTRRPVMISHLHQALIAPW